MYKIPAELKPWLIRIAFIIAAGATLGNGCNVGCDDVTTPANQQPNNTNVSLVQRNQSLDKFDLTISDVADFLHISTEYSEYPTKFIYKVNDQPQAPITLVSNTQTIDQKDDIAQHYVVTIPNLQPGDKLSYHVNALLYYDWEGQNPFSERTATCPIPSNTDNSLVVVNAAAATGREMIQINCNAVVGSMNTNAKRSGDNFYFWLEGSPSIPAGLSLQSVKVMGVTSWTSNGIRQQLGSTVYSIPNAASPISANLGNTNSGTVYYKFVFTFKSQENQQVSCALPSATSSSYQLNIN